MMPKRLSAVNVAEMNLNGWDIDGGDRVSQGNAGVRVSASIN